MASKASLVGGFALVTGAAAGIGKETALEFAEAGAEGVAFADLNLEGAQKAAEESKQFATIPGFRAIAIHVDVTQEDSVKSMVDTVMKEFRRIDYSINSAGMGNVSGATVQHLKVDVFSKTIETNIKGTMLCVRAVSEVMAQQEPLTYKSRRHGERSLGRGSIVNLGSINSYIAAPGMLSYTTSKHAVIGLTKSAAIDCLKSHIRVNAVCPSWVDTPMNKASLERVPQLGKMIQTMAPLRRVANTEEVADYILFLCSPSASYINGTGLCIDSGMTLTSHAT
ncbi:NAD(P)-binding protein [Annulohypoxylon moriforme]|nr:NAD(P)-binding protein [Annulohypoxylon moriforme]